MSSRLLLTVCIPTIGSNAFLDEAVASVARAWVDGMELVIFDNACEREIKPDIFERAGVTGRIVRSADRLPMAQSWNHCLKIGSGEWIHLLHDDDWVEPEFYREFYSSITDQKRGLWACSCFDDYEDPSLNRVSKVPDAATADPVAIGEVIFNARLRCPGVILYRAACAAVRGADERLRQLLDADLFWRCACKDGAFFYSKPLAHYRIHRLSATGTDFTARRHPILDDGRLLSDLTLILKKNDGSRAVPSLRKYSHDVLTGALRYYLRRFEFSQMHLLLSCWLEHLRVFYFKREKRFRLEDGT